MARQHFRKAASFKQSAWHWWRMWEIVVRNGFEVRNKRYKLAHLVICWAIMLAAVHMLNALVRVSAPGSRRAQHMAKSSSTLDIDFWRGRHLIFCISPGRSGSKYLRHVLDVAEKVISHHEPEPKMTGTVLQHTILQGKRNETFKERSRIKLSAIKQALEGTSPDVAYAETSHMFVKTFADVILDNLGDETNITVIFLHRAALDTIWSQLRLGWFSADHSGRNVWYYDINDIHESEKYVSYNSNSASSIDSLIGYNLDVHQRGMELQRKIESQHRVGEWKHVRLLQTKLTDLSGDRISKFLHTLHLKVDFERLAHLKYRDSNSRDVKKDVFKGEITIEDVEKRINDTMEQLALTRKAGHRHAKV